MKIRDIVTKCLSTPNLKEEASDSAQDDIVVDIITDEPGITGVGETDAPPGVVKAFIDMPSSHDTSVSLKKILVGEDPLQIEKLWNKMYERTLMAGLAKLADALKMRVATGEFLNTRTSLSMS